MLEAQAKTCVRRLINARQCKRVLPGGGSCLVALSGLLACLSATTPVPSTRTCATTMPSATERELRTNEAERRDDEAENHEQLEQAEILRALGRALLHVVTDCMGQDSAAYAAAQDRARLLINALSELAGDEAAGSKSDADKARCFGLALQSLALPSAVHGGGRLWRLVPIRRGLPGAPASSHGAALCAHSCSHATGGPRCVDGEDDGDDESVWDDVRGVSGAIDRALDLVCLLLSSGVCLVVNVR